MIRFENWTIQADGDILARQFDNLTRTITLTGDIPAGWEWDVLVQVGNAMDIIPLAATEDGLSAVLTAQQLSIAGYYQMQLSATQGDKVQHTNRISVYVDKSLSGDEQWPEIPSEFTQLEQRVKADADRAEEAAKRAEEAGGSGGSSGKDGGYYTPAVTQSTVDTMRVSYIPSSPDMPDVAPSTVTLPTGPAGKDGTDGRDGKDGAQGPRGPSGVYVGSGDMPEDCNVQIDPDGDAMSMGELVERVLDNLPAAEGVAY